MNRSEEAGYKQQVFFLSAGGNVVSIYWNESKSRRCAAKDVTFISQTLQALQHGSSRDLSIADTTGERTGVEQRDAHKVAARFGKAVEDFFGLRALGAVSPAGSLLASCWGFLAVIPVRCAGGTRGLPR